MKRCSITMAAMLLGLVSLHGEEETAKPRDPEQMYLTALATLDDDKTTTISGALPLLEESAAQGYPDAVILLLDVYGGHRKGIDAQETKAAGLAKRVAEGSLPLDSRYPAATAARQECMFRYALFCERGVGCDKDEREAKKKEAKAWMKRAAQEGLEKAKVEFARYAMMGIGSMRNPRKALQILIEQAKRDPSAPNLFFYMGYIYQKGLGMRPDQKMAAKCYTKGELFGDARAINNLAGMYEQGIGVPRDRSKALKLYKKAAAIGNKDASANMQRLAYVKAKEDSDASAMQKINRAALRVIKSMPLSAPARDNLSRPFLHEGAAHGNKAPAVP